MQGVRNCEAGLVMHGQLAIFFALVYFSSFRDARYTTELFLMLSALTANWVRGRKKAVWVSTSADLRLDAGMPCFLMRIFLHSPRR